MSDLTNEGYIADFHPGKSWLSVQSNKKSTLDKLFMIRSYRVSCLTYAYTRTAMHFSQVGHKDPRMSCHFGAVAPLPKVVTLYPYFEVIGWKMMNHGRPRKMVMSFQIRLSNNKNLMQIKTISKMSSQLAQSINVMQAVSS